MPASAPSPVSSAPATAIAPSTELSTLCHFDAAGSGDPLTRLTDKGYRVPFKALNGTLSITAPQGEKIAWLYLCFAEMPDAWTLETLENGQWETYLHGGTDYSHLLLRLPELKSVRVHAPNNVLSLNELRVFSSGELPSDVQQWQPTIGKADLLLLVGHPDDEYLFFGGLIPWYVAQQKRVLVAYMTCQDSTRRAELLNGLWAVGVRNYPVIGSFIDRSTRTLDKMYAIWGREEIDSFLVKLIRQHQPDVLVTHALGGEYGHGAHRACADSALRMFDKTADPMYLPQHAKTYGSWQVKKLYLHLYKQNELRLDWSLAIGTETAIALAKRGFAMHVSQQHFYMQNDRNMRYDDSLFGLAKTVVGLDLQKDGFFENIK